MRTIEEGKNKIYSFDIVIGKYFNVDGWDFNVVNNERDESMDIEMIGVLGVSILLDDVVLVHQFKDGVENYILVAVMIDMIFKREYILPEVDPEFFVLLFEMGFVLLEHIWICSNSCCLLLKISNSLLHEWELLIEPQIESDWKERRYLLNEFRVVLHQTRDTEWSERIDHCIQKLQLLVEFYLFIEAIVSIDSN